MRNRIARSLVVLAGLVFLPTAAVAVCSDYHGLATVNEIKDQGRSDFVEVKILDGDIQPATYNDWTIRLCSDRGGCSGTIHLGDGDASGFPWIVIDHGVIQDRRLVDLDGMDVILQDATGDTIDYVAVDGHNPQQDASCAGAFDSTANGPSGSGLVSRNPDGTGDWQANNRPNQDTSSEDNSGDPSLPDLSVGDAVALPGDTAIFTLTLDAAASSDITLQYQTVDDTATSPGDYVAVSAGLTIPAGATSATISVPTQEGSDGGGFYLRLSDVSNASAVDAVGQGTIVPPALAEYRMDAAGWSGGGDEVVDSSGNGYHGTPSNGLSTVPAQVCNGGDFQGGDTVTVDDADALSPLATDGAMTITGWVRRNAGGNGTLVHKGHRVLFFFAAHEYRIRIDNGQLEAGLYEYLGGSPSSTPTVPTTLAADTWYFFALTAERDGQDLIAELRLYAENGLLGSDSGPVADFFDGYDSKVLSGDLRFGAFLDSGAGDYLDGTLDELRIHSRALGADEIVALRDETRPCPGGGGPSAIILEHDGAAVTCQAEPVTVRVVDAAGDPVEDFTGTVDLSTDTGNGAWSVIAPSNAQGSLAGAGGDDGQASYTFADADNGAAVLGLRDTHIEDVDIGAVQQGDASVTDDDSEGLLSFAEVGFQFRVDGVPGNIGPQIGGKPSDTAPGAQGIELEAIRTNDQTGACEAAFQGPTDVDFQFDCLDPGTCQASQLLVNGTAVTANAGDSSSQSQAVSLDFGGATDTTAPLSFRYDDVGRIRLRPEKILQPNGQVMTGPSNGFVVRPFALRVGADGNPEAGGPAGPIYQAAGTEFTARVAAVLWAAADDTDADGVADGHDDDDPSNNADLSGNAVAANFGNASGDGEDVSLSASLQQPASGRNPGLAGGTTVINFSVGEGTSNTVRFGEVGIVELRAAIADGQYLDLGSGQTANIVGRSGTVGRFVPDHFTTSITDPTGSFAAACTGGAADFAYTGERFDYMVSPVFTAVARPAAGAATAVTENYQGAFNKLTGGGLGADIDTTGTDDGSGLTWDRTAGTLSVAGNGDGTTDIALDGDSFVYPKDQAGAEQGPFQPDIDIGLNSYQDGDGVAASDTPTVLPVDGSTMEIRYGRLAVVNAYGSEMLPLEMPLEAEYFDGPPVDGYITNTADVCSAYDAANVTFENFSGALSGADVAAYGNGTLVSGRADPANPLEIGGTGGSDTGPGVSGAVDVVLGVAPYLRYDWDPANAGLEDPRGRATFGIYRGSDSVIYQRELY